MKLFELKDKNNKSTELFKIEGFTSVNEVFDRLHKHFDMIVIDESDSLYTDETEGRFNYVYVASDGNCRFVESLTEFSENYQTEEDWQVYNSVEVQWGNRFIKYLFVYSGIIKNRETMEDGFYESLYNMEMDYYDEIEKLRVLSNEGKITGDEFLDKFFLLRSSLSKI